MIAEWVLIVVSTWVCARAVRRVAGQRSCSIADFVIPVVYLFNCLPILCDQFFGYPEYPEWFWRLQGAMEVGWVRLYYAGFMLAVLLCLEWYVAWRRRQLVHCAGPPIPRPSGDALKPSHAPLAWIATLSPYVLVGFLVLLLGLDHFLVYGSSSFRGIPGNYAFWISVTLLASVLGSVAIFFSSPRSVGIFAILALHLGVLLWIDGKRYLIPTIVLAFIFGYVNSEVFRLSRLASAVSIVVLSITFVGFFLWYGGEYKTVDNDSAEGVYATLRMDFGRDDITKFAISRADVDNPEPILEYPGQGALGTLLMPLPRSLFEDKPYPYYRYLTGSILGIPQDEIPAGLTPSVLAMSVSDWGLTFGPLMAVAALLALCWFGDRQSTLFAKLAVLLATVGLLTQSADAVAVPLVATAWLSLRPLWASAQVDLRRSDWVRM